ncbi:protein of unknown function [Pseudomonas sp. JV551A1]|uniref:Uncharacterized protein n=1 Tax=Pseudomonas inefficax TaxID=2078786 RepID=A0AAQ1SRZ4_9PSED|nr:protein of unknown function [Pseudomonas sp. JV551A1]SPO58940.1 protein of unknown function [Pseudomonas inefficax]
MDSPRQAGTPIFAGGATGRATMFLHVQRALIDDQTWAHGGAQGNALDVDTFRGSWLDTLQVSDQGFNVFLQLAGFEADLANGGVDDTVLVGTVANLTSLGVLDGAGYVWGHGTNFRVRHQAARTQNLTQLTYNAHGIRRCDDDVIVQVAAFHFGSQVVHTYAVSAGSQSGFSSWTLGEDSNANGLASAVWQHGSATYDLVGFTRVNTEVNGDVVGLYELGSRQRSQQSGRFFEVVGLACFDFLGDRLLAFGQLSHYTPSTFRPMLRAEPAMVRTAASRSAAVRSACLALAMSSS